MTNVESHSLSLEGERTGEGEDFGKSEAKVIAEISPAGREGIGHAMRERDGAAPLGSVFDILSSLVH
jgi:hypothetical protein